MSLWTVVILAALQGMLSLSLISAQREMMKTARKEMKRLAHPIPLVLGFLIAGFGLPAAWIWHALVMDDWRYAAPSVIAASVAIIGRATATAP